MTYSLLKKHATEIFRLGSPRSFEFRSELDILLDPLGQLLRNICVADIRSPPRGALLGPAPVHLLEVERVLAHIEPASTAIALGVCNPRAHGDVGRGRVGAGEPVLGRGVAIVENDRRQTRDGVARVGDAILLAGLVGHEIGKEGVADTWRAEGVNVGGISATTEVGSADGGDGGTEGVASDNDRVLGVRSLGLLDAVDGGGRDLLPGCVESGVDEAAKGEIAWGLNEDETSRGLELGFSVGLEDLLGYPVADRD